MTAATTQATPAVPPRPSRNSDKDSSSGSASGPKIPPRPSRKRPERSLSPNADRFAPSPLNEGILPKNHSKTGLLSPNRGLFEPVEDPIGRPGSVPMPSVGEEGMEYSAIADELENEEKERSRSTSPEQTRTVAEDLKLHAPKPSLPADSAKQRVMAVTRTDSERAASFGIGRPSDEDRAVSRERAVSRDAIKKRPSTSFSMNSDVYTDDEQGIPEIGQRVPMNPHLGDVQAPSPGPSEGSSRHHKRNHSSRALPPGSYGLHGHGVTPLDRLDREYYQKHPELLKKEEHTPIHDRQNDYALTSTELNRLVRETASRGAGLATDPEFTGTPTDEVAFQASDEYVRISSPRPGSAAQKEGHSQPTSLAQVVSNRSTPSDVEPEEGGIHVDEPTHEEYRSYGDEPPRVDDKDHEYDAPILASDEVEKYPNDYLQQPAVHPRSGRRGSNHDSEDAPSRSLSRPTSLHRNNSSQPEIHYTPLEDVEEYEPLFTEEAKEKKKAAAAAADENKHHNHFPSKDIWEDAPSSVHYTATVSTPDLPETEHHRSRSSGHHGERPITPAHAFAQHQEALAEKEAKRRSGGFLPLNEEKKSIWASHQAQLKVQRPATGPRFPSRDIWEDAPESQLHEATITPSSPDEEKRPDFPARPAKKPSVSSDRPAVPTRPKPRQGSGDDAKPKPPVSEKPKPQIPARKEKPPVPSRPAGSKIAALQAGFMSDLNQRLKIGPQVHKKEEPSEKEAPEEKEKVPLSDARKGRARGPQRRAPAKSPAPPAEAAKPSGPVLSFSMPQSSWSIDPEEGRLAVDGEEGEVPEQKSPVEEVSAEKEEEPEEREEQPAEPESKPEPAEPVEPSKSDDKVEDAEAPAEASEEAETAEEPEREEKTLVANMAGESVLEVTVDKKDGGDKVDPVDVEDEVKP